MTYTILAFFINKKPDPFVEVEAVTPFMECPNRDELLQMLPKKVKQRWIRFTNDWWSRSLSEEQLAEIQYKKRFRNSVDQKWAYIATVARDWNFKQQDKEFAIAWLFSLIIHKLPKGY